MRLYLLEGDKIRRVGLNSQGKRKFTGLAGKNALLINITYTPLSMPVILKVGITVIDFDEEGRWYLDPAEIRKAAYKSDSVFEDKEKTPSNLVRFLPQPKISNKQRELLKAQIVKEFGIATWNFAIQRKLV